jgi:hypothetical protein
MKRVELQDRAVISPRMTRGAPGNPLYGAFVGMTRAEAMTLANRKNLSIGFFISAGLLIATVGYF